MGQCSHNPCLEANLRDETADEVVNAYNTGGLSSRANEVSNVAVLNRNNSCENERDSSRTAEDPFTDTSAALVERPNTMLENGISYTGQWVGNNREGYGMLVRPDGSRYAGEFKMNKAHGKGIFTHPSGDVYDGQWLHDRAHGFGKFTHSGGSYYEGQWVDDLQDGYGIEGWSDGSRFSGYYKGSKKNGKGNFVWGEGATYEGDFLDNEIHGHGSYKWVDGRVYTGQWEHNHMHGKGRLQWSDGRVYEGDYVHDKKEGYGGYTWPDGRIFQGYWKDGKQHGVGVYINGKGVERRGLWVEGKRERWIQEEEAKTGYCSSTVTTSESQLPTKAQCTPDDKADVVQALPPTPRSAFPLSENQSNDIRSQKQSSDLAASQIGENSSDRRRSFHSSHEPLKKPAFFRRIMGWKKLS